MTLESLALWVGTTAVEAVIGDLATGGGSKLSAALRAGLTKSEPLQRDVQSAVEEAWRGFVSYFAGVGQLSDADLINLQELAQSPAAQQVSVELIYRGPARTETAVLRRLFATHRPAHAEDDDFEHAWVMLVRRFQRALAEKPELSSLLRIAHESRLEDEQARQTEALEQLGKILENFVAQASPKPRRVELSRYLTGLARELRWADTRGLFMRETEGVAEQITLLQVFVPPVLEELRAPETRLAGTPQTPDPHVHGRFTDLGSVVEAGQCSVVLGPPGCGKSTLLRALALVLCGEKGGPTLPSGLDGLVPIQVPLKTYASALQTDARLQLTRFIEDDFSNRLPSVLALIAEGAALVMFDGLDEVFDGNDRLWVTQQIWSMVSINPGCRFVVTSRPHGYKSAPLPSVVGLFEVVAFDRQQIRTFFRNWFSALNQVGGDADASQQPEARSEALANEVFKRERLLAMARNPLLCTLIVLVHRSRSGRLPERRAQFLEAAVRTFAEVWETYKLAPRQELGRLEYPEPDVVIQALAEVAWRAFHELTGRVIPAATLETWLREFLERQPEWQGMKARRATRDLLTLVEHRLGLLVNVGGEAYEFVHFNLHEYLAAHFLLTRLTDEERKLVVLYYLHAPGWEEVLRLTLGAATPIQCDQLIDAILSFPSSDVEDFLGRDLVFICQCLADRAPASLQARNRIASRCAMALSRVSDLRMSNFALEAAQAGPLPGILETIKSRLTTLLFESDWHAREGALKFLASFKDETLSGALAERLAHDNLESAVLALRHFTAVRDARPPVSAVVEQHLRNPNWQLRSAAVQYFNALGVVSDPVAGKIRAMRTDPERYVRMVVMRCLLSHAQSPAEVDAILIRSLNDSDGDIRAVSLRRLLQQQQLKGFEQRLEGFLGSSEAAKRAAGLEWLSVMADPGDSYKVRVVGLLSDTEPAVVLTAIGCHVTIWGESEECRNACLRLLDHEDAQVRSRAIARLEDVGVTFDRRMELYQTALKGTAKEEVQMAWLMLKENRKSLGFDVAEHLIATGPAAVAAEAMRLLVTPWEHVDFLTQCLHHRHGAVREATLGLLEQVGRLDFGPDLVNLARDDADGAVREAAIRAFARRCDDADMLLAVLESALRDPLAGVRQAAVGSFCSAKPTGLGRAFYEGARGFGPVVALLCDEVPLVRQEILRVISDLGQLPTEYRSLILACAREADQDVRRLAFDCLKKFPANSEQELPELLAICANPELVDLVASCVIAWGLTHKALDLALEWVRSDTAPQCLAALGFFTGLPFASTRALEAVLDAFERMGRPAQLDAHLAKSLARQASSDISILKPIFARGLAFRDSAVENIILARVATLEREYRNAQVLRISTTGRLDAGEATAIDAQIRQRSVSVWEVMQVAAAVPDEPRPSPIGEGTQGRPVTSVQVDMMAAAYRDATDESAVKAT